MKVLLINGSPKRSGCVDVALREVEKGLHANGVGTEMIWIGGGAVRGCIACGACERLGKCVYDDAVNEIAEKFRDADGLVVGSPVYYGSPNGTLISLLDRLFYSTPFDKRMKVGASVVSCRRGGNTASFDVLNKYFTMLLLEPDPRKHGPGGPGRQGGPADHAHPGEQHGLPHQGYRPGA